VDIPTLKGEFELNKPKILGFIPAYNCENQLPRVLQQLDQPWIKERISNFIVVENRSTDSTLKVATEESIKRNNFVSVISNNNNYGLGGSHKVAIDFAKENGFDWILVFHGDDQGNLNDFQPIITSGQFDHYDAVLGARFTAKSKRFGYGQLRTFGNYVFNGFYSLFLQRLITDMGSGLNMYRVSAMDKSSKNAPDGLIHPPYLLISIVLNNFKTKFEAISWKETDQVSNAKLFSQSIDTFKLGFLAFLLRRRFLNIDYSNKDLDYSYKLIEQSL
jgi:glycosyltransferase involved in cell wall biosynthesis